MPDYTPTTEQVRDAYLLNPSRDRKEFQRWLRELKAEVWAEGRRANGYLFGHEYYCAGYSDCHCETYINPYTEESAAIVAFCGDTEQHDSHDVPARGTPDSGWHYLPAFTCPGFFRCGECYEIGYTSQSNHTCQEEA